MTPEKFLSLLLEEGVDTSCGVPCSLLGDLILGLSRSRKLEYLPLCNEGEAVAYAAGAWLAGKKPLVLMQNSGLGNAVNPLTSLAQSFEIPLALLVSWRGRPGSQDAPQHQLMGNITPHLLELMRIPCRVLLNNDAGFQAPDLGETTVRWMARAPGQDRNPRALVLPKGVLRVGKSRRRTAPVPVIPTRKARQPLSPPLTSGPPPTRTRALEAILKRFGVEVPILATTGKTGRELFTLRDSPNHFYLVGSMGCATSLGLGVARNWKESRPVVVVDGDGAALMRLEAMASVGASAPENYLHILLDNRAYDSTGGQPTVSAGVDFVALANSLGYPFAARAEGIQGFQKLLKAWRPDQGPGLIHLQIKPGSPADLTRPDQSPPWYARRFRDFLLGGEA